MVQQIDRRASLALRFQEILTAVVRLRYGKQNVSNSDTFREHMRNALRMASENANRRGYSHETVKVAAESVVAFLDETVIGLGTPAFLHWSAYPMYQELFGEGDAGELFFDNIERLLADRDKKEVAEVLEVYAQCLLLGFRGRLRTAENGEVTALLENMKDKIRGIRGGYTGLSPHWELPEEAPPPRKLDPLAPKLTVATGAAAALALILLAGGMLMLWSGAGELHRLLQ